MNELDNKQGVDEQLRELALFAGAGGGILGGKLLGWRTVCAVEIEPYPASVLCARQNDGVFSPFPIWDDVCTFDGKPWRGLVDVVSGGFPCQDISAAGRHAGIEGARSGLWAEFARIICEVRPQYVLVENSPLLISRGLAVLLGDLAKLGYDAKWGIIGVDDIGGPHCRKRCWVLASDTTKVGRLKTANDLQGKASSQVEVWRKDTFNSLLAAEKVQYSVQSEDQRMGDGLAFGVEQFSAIGNGQVPAVAATAWKTLSAGL